MASPTTARQQGRAAGVIDRIEETIIAALLGSMTLLTFANVIARFFFNSNILWALELTVYMFAWLVLLGASYALKKGAHLGVDAIVNLVGPGLRRVFGIASAVACISFAFLLLKGSWDYWANFANLPATEGRWFPLGFEEKFRGKGWYETNDIPVPGALKWLEGAFNEGEAYEKMPRLVPYFILPFSMALLLLRSLQVSWALWTGKVDMLIASHEVEEAVEEAAAKLKEQ
ncbi:MAG: TRAP transporter small permease [Pseudomonadota bacterium]